MLLKRENFCEKRDHSLPFSAKSDFLCKIYAAKLAYITVCKSDTVLKKALRTAVNCVDLVKCRLEEEASCAEQKVKRICGADVERYY